MGSESSERQKQGDQLGSILIICVREDGELDQVLAAEVVSISGFKYVWKIEPRGRDDSLDKRCE
jgi:hypothetical protein